MILRFIKKKAEPLSEPTHGVEFNYPIKPSDIEKRGDYKGYITMKTLTQAAADYEEDKGDNVFTVTSEMNRSPKLFYEYLSKYINFINDDGSMYEPPIEGSGRRKPKPKKEIIPSIEPAMLFNDVKNDPYFIIQ